MDQPDYSIRQELDALALEYQREYGSAGRNLDLSDFVNNAPPHGPVGILRPCPGLST